MQIKALGEQARFIVKSFRYIGRPSGRSVKLGFYITKLAEATGFDLRRLHEATYQGQILEWKQEYAESQNKGRSYIPNPFKQWCIFFIFQAFAVPAIYPNYMS